MDATVGRATVEHDETTPLLSAAGAAPGSLSCGIPQQQSAIAAPHSEAAIAATSERAADVRATVGTTLVLVANTLERTAYFALTTSLVYFLTRAPLCWSDDQAVFASLLFASVSFAACALGGLLADCVTSRFGAVAVGYVLYVVACFFLVALAGRAAPLEDTPVPESNASAIACKRSRLISIWQLPSANGSASSAELCGNGEPQCSTYLITSWLLIAIAQGIVHTNLVAFGADQVRRYGTETTRCYFSMLYWTRNLGAVAAVAGLSFLQIDNSGFFHNSLASLACLFISAVVFGAGFKFYVRQKPNRYAIKKILRIPRDALRLKWLAADRHWPNGSPDSILDYAKVYYGGTHHDKTVEEVKTAGRMLIVFVLLIGYAVGFTQLVSSFATQGLHMKAPELFSHQIPPGFFLVFDSLSVLITLPFLNNLVYPFLGRRGYRMTLHIRISAGMLVAALSFVLAGIIETVRLQSLASGAVPQQIGHTIYDAARMPVLYQIPQYVFLGISEAFVCVTAMEYTYLFAPKAMRSIMIGLLLAFPSIGPFISYGLRQLYANELGWSNINYGHMDYAFYTLAGVQLVTSLAFYAIGRWWSLGLDLSTIPTMRRLPSQLLHD